MDIKKRSRIGYIDIAKCIAMFLVIHNHWMLDYNNNIIKIIIASFHMPLFFFLSGMTMKEISNKNDLFLQIFKRFCTLMIPYYLWSFIFAGFSIKTALLILWGSNPSIAMAGGVGGSWFIPCIFASYIVVSIIGCCFKSGKIVNKILVIIVLLLISYLLNKINITYGFPLNFDVALSGSAFILLGKMSKDYDMFDKLNKLSRNKRMAIFVCSLVLTIFFAIINVPAYSNDYHRLVMALGYYGIFPLFICSGLIGSVCIILLAMIMDSIGSFTSIKNVGRNTFLILMLQQFCINTIERILSIVSLKFNFFIPILLSIICIMLCHIMGRIISYICPNLNGKYIFPERTNNKGYYNE